MNLLLAVASATQPSHTPNFTITSTIDAWTQLALTYGPRLLGILLILITSLVVSTWIKRLTHRSLTKVRFDITLTHFFAALARWAVLIFAVLLCLHVFGVQTTSFAALIAALGLAVGLAFQGTLSNFAAGIMLLAFRPFKVGDVVQISGEMGTIAEIEIFFTLLDTFDNRRLILPNSSVFGTKIENISHHPVRRADIAVGVEYTADIDQTRQVLENAAKSVEGQAEGKEPAVILLDLGASSVDWSVRVWAPAADFMKIKQAATRAVKKALDDAGIGIPFPQMDVHLDRTDIPGKAIHD